jgi:DNA polymerase III psi subunit
MDTQLTASGEALRLFFTDDVYLVNETDLQLNAAENIVMEPEALAVAFKFLGKNQRNILILVNDDQNEVSDEMGRELLRKIVKSVNLTANDFALLNYAGYSGTGFKQLLDYFSCTLIFAFGVTPAQLSLSAHPEHVIVSEGPVRLIFSAGLRQLDQNPSGKKALWGSLQNLGL